ncbi:MAG TPA: hypothetical protein VE687_19185 [Stellaceae bacterium]|nr:hypothetical protein [Stellaceae bacterium]
MAAAGQRFDVVLALETVEHVADPAVFFASVGARHRDGFFIGVDRGDGKAKPRHRLGDQAAAAADIEQC